MSPSGRSKRSGSNSDGVLYVFGIASIGYTTFQIVDNTTSSSGGVRPVVSLIPGVVAASGSGTATNPWIVNPVS